MCRKKHIALLLCCHDGGSNSGSLPGICGYQVCLLITVTVSSNCSDTPNWAMLNRVQCSDDSAFF